MHLVAHRKLNTQVFLYLTLCFHLHGPVIGKEDNFYLYFEQHHINQDAKLNFNQEILKKLCSKCVIFNTIFLMCQFIY